MPSRTRSRSHPAHTPVDPLSIRNRPIVEPLHAWLLGFDVGALRSEDRRCDLKEQTVTLDRSRQRWPCKESRPLLSMPRTIPEPDSSRAREYMLAGRREDPGNCLVGGIRLFDHRSTRRRHDRSGRLSRAVEGLGLHVSTRSRHTCSRTVSTCCHIAQAVGLPVILRRPRQTLPSRSDLKRLHARLHPRRPAGDRSSENRPRVRGAVGTQNGCDRGGSVTCMCGSAY